MFRQGGVLQKVSRLISEEPPAFNELANLSPKVWTQLFVIQQVKVHLISIMFWEGYQFFHLKTEF